jgi:ammonia channel protein AmtB
MLMMMVGYTLLETA